jgi:hypothetical protein
MEYVRLMSAFPPRTTGVVVTKCEILAEYNALHEPKMLLTIPPPLSGRIFTVCCNVKPVWFQKPPEYDVMLLVLKQTTGARLDAEGNVALRLFAIDAKVSCRVPVAAVAADGVKVNATCSVSDAVVPEPDVMVPDDAEALYAVPAAIAVSVVAVMLVAVPTVNAGCERLTVVGSL